MFISKAFQRPCWKNYISGSIWHKSFIKMVKYSDHVYLSHLSTECRSILSADVATDTRPIYRLTLGRYVGRDSADMNRQACRPTSGRYLGDTRPTLRSLGQLLLSSCYRVPSSLLYWERLSVAVVLFWPLTPAIFMSFFHLCFFLVIAFIYDPRYFRMWQHLGIVAFGGSLF